MKMGVMLGAGSDLDASLEGIIDAAKRCEALGFDSMWIAYLFAFDAITSIALVGREISSIAKGIALAPSYPRHSVALRSR
jgi:alkanesulfonate monooxygenase SsuD/methylene tetrahydromethanopterin reductase-like flavin-dependent oxidoreductase (luciferase family)